LLLY
jgi:hypothetical protein